MKHLGIGETDTFVVFQIDERSYGLPVHTVDLVVRMVEITELPGLPEFISGVVNYHGEVIPVIDLRKRFGFTPKSVSLNDKLMIVKSQDRKFALIADEVRDVLTCEISEITEVCELFPELHHLKGIAKVKNGLILLNDIDHILPSLEHEEVLNVLKQVQL